MLKFWPVLTWLGFLATLVIARHYGTVKVDAKQYRKVRRIGRIWFYISMVLFVITVAAFTILLAQH